MSIQGSHISCFATKSLSEFAQIRLKRMVQPWLNCDVFVQAWAACCFEKSLEGNIHIYVVFSLRADFGQVYTSRSTTATTKNGQDASDASDARCEKIILLRCHPSVYEAWRITWTTWPEDLRRWPPGLGCDSMMCRP